MTRAGLFSRHTALADRIARDYWLPGADRDDVIQEARLALWLATDTFHPGRGASFATYARRAIHADLRDKLQAACRHKQLVLSDAGRDEELETVAGPSLERVVVARATLARITGAMAALTPAERDAVVRVVNGAGVKQDKRLDNAAQRARRKLRRAVA